MEDLSSDMSVASLEANGLNTPVKKQRWQVHKTKTQLHAVRDSLQIQCHSEAESKRG